MTKTGNEAGLLRCRSRPERASQVVSTELAVMERACVCQGTSALTALAGPQAPGVQQGFFTAIKDAQMVRVEESCKHKGEQISWLS